MNVIQERTGMKVNRLGQSLNALPYIVATLVLTMAISLTALISNVSAAAVTMSLSSSAANVQKGGTFTVDVRVNSGSAQYMDASARVNYNPSQLSLTSTSIVASGMSEGPSVGSGAGYYNFDIIKLGAPFPSGNSAVFRLTFQAVGSSGSTPISLSDASMSDAGSPPPATHSVSVQGVSIGLQAPPSAGQPANPGTTVPPTTGNNGGGGGGGERGGGGETATPIVGTPTDPNTNQATAITDQTAVEAANADNAEAAEAYTASLASGSSSSSLKKKLPVTLILSLAGVAVVALIFQAYLVLRKPKNVMTGGGGSIVGNMDDKF